MKLSITSLTRKTKDLSDAVVRGETVILTRQGEDFAVITPFGSAHTKPVVDPAMERQKYMSIHNPEHPMSEPDLTSPRCEAPYTNCRLPGEQYEVEYVTEEGMGNKRVSLCLEHAKKAGATSGLRKVE